MPHICKNCGARYKGNYCNQCGQRAKVGRLTLRSVIDNWAYGLTNCDRGILFTFKELFIRPGHMLADYVSGKRIVHFQPFPMLFITAGFYGLMSQILLPAKPVEAVQTVTDLTFWERFFNLLEQWIDSSMSLTAIVTLPFFAWASRLAFYTPPFHPYGPGTRKGLSAWIYYHTLPPRKRSYNYTLSDYRFIATYHARYRYQIRKKYTYNFTEYIFIFAYIACQRLILALFIALPIMVCTHTTELTDNSFQIVYSLYFAVTVWDLKQLFKIGFWKALRKTALMFLYSGLLILLFTILITAIIIGVIYILGLLDLLSPEILKVIEEDL